jgi:hypothetical protein
MEKIIIETGFSMEIIQINYWDKLPLKQSQIHGDYKIYDKEKLLVRECRFFFKKIILCAE